MIHRSGLQVWSQVRDVLASGYCDRAKPLSVSGIAVAAILGKRILSGGCGVARNLLE